MKEIAFIRIEALPYRFGFVYGSDRGIILIGAPRRSLRGGRGPRGALPFFVLTPSIERLLYPVMDTYFVNSEVT